MVRARRKILKILFRPRKTSVLFKTKLEQLFVMAMEQMMKQKLIITFTLSSVICIKKHYFF